MRQSTSIARAAVFALELLIVVAAVFGGAHFANGVRLIPKSVIHLPVINFGPDDVRVVLKSYLLACGITFLVARLFAGWRVFAQPNNGARRVAIEVYALVTGIVAASLYMFFLTAVNFSPELLLQSTLIALALILLAFLIFGQQRGVGARASGFFVNLFALLKRPAAILVLLFALTPVFVGNKFATDRNFANWVTKLRINANVSQDRPFTLVNALGQTKFTTPIMVQFARHDPHTLYVLTRNGELWRSDYPSGGHAQMLMNIADRVAYVEMENGALGFDLHPEFGQPGSKSAGFVYIYYTENHKDAPDPFFKKNQIDHLTRFDLSLPTPQAREASALPLIDQGRQNDGYHNAGMVAFGPDNMLYLSLGEMSMEDCHQRLDCSLVGGILRLDVDNRGGAVSRPILRQPLRGRTANYMVPLDNPYANRGAAALGEYYAHGLRNPFRFAFDPKDNSIWAGEVGSTTWEEVNHILPGHNYQFPYIEGYTDQPLYPKPTHIDGIETPPVLTYHHTAFMRSVIGGTVYRAAKYPALQGKYIFGDNYSGEIMTIPTDRARVDKWDVVARASDVAQRGLTAMVVAPDGEVLVPVMGAMDAQGGMVAKLVPSSSAVGRAANAAIAANAAAEAHAPIVAISLSQAKSVYNINCARCHGENGKGNAEVAQQLGDYIPNFTDPNFHKYFTDAHVLAVLHGGGGAIGRSTAMPPWDGVLKEGEMVGVKNYVRTFNAAAKTG